ncbi:hypothetical protein ACET3X_009973 [Alternaria dauci]|uniref:Uncharacterized protein n=1 Tax=Alternaria dauci TaxID=48095 RepID=A0ABR3U7T9_9PLEO
MADLPAHISGYETLEPPTLDSDITAPTSFPPLPSSVSQRRTRYPPAPTIYLTGFRCHISDPEYNYAREMTGEIQPYWFEESYSAAGFAEGVRRRARRDMGPHEDVVAVIDLGDDGEDMDSDQSESSSMTREEEWKQIEAERKRLEKEMKKLKSSEMGQRLASGALGLLDFLNETEGTGNSSAEAAGSQKLLADSF